MLTNTLHEPVPKYGSVDDHGRGSIRAGRRLKANCELSVKIQNLTFFVEIERFVPQNLRMSHGWPPPFERRIIGKAGGLEVVQKVCEKFPFHTLKMPDSEVNCVAVVVRGASGEGKTLANFLNGVYA